MVGVCDGDWGRWPRFDNDCFRFDAEDVEEGGRGTHGESRDLLPPRHCLVTRAVSQVSDSLTTSLATAEPKNHETQFSVKFGLIEVGIAKFNIKFDENSYSLMGSGS